MSNRHAYETRAIERLIEHLAASGVGDYVVEDEHVPVGRKNCDFLLASRTGGARKLAVEVVRIIDNQGEMELHHFRDVHWEALKRSLKELGVVGVLVRTPWSIRTVPRATNRLVPELAIRIKAALDAEPDAKSVTVEGHEVIRIPDLPGVVPSANSGVHYVDGPGLTDLVLTTLEIKDAQLALSNVDRILLAVAWSTSLDATSIARQFARRTDLERLIHVDRVVFLDQSGLETIYSRDVRDFFATGGALPKANEALSWLWFSTRLAHHHPGTFELVRETEKATGSLAFLNTEAKEALAHHGTHLVELGRLEDAFWIVRNLKSDDDPPAESRPSSGGICTVRGTTTWLTHRLAAAVSAAALPELVQYTKAFAVDPNAYVREMASFIFRVLMARRDELREGSYLLDDQLRSSIKQAWRPYMDSAAADGRADEAASTLAFVFDLDPAEVIEVFGSILGDVSNEGMRDLARSALYFAQLRGTDALPNEFDDSQVRGWVQALARSNPKFRDQLGFLLFRSMTDHPEVRPAMSELVPLLLDVGPDGSTGFAIECVALLAASGILDRGVEQQLLECLTRAVGLARHEKFDLAFRLAAATETLAAARQDERVERWLSTIVDADLLEFVDRTRVRLAAKRNQPPARQ